MEEFLATVCTMEWNAELDRGAPFDQASAPLLERHPDKAGLILAYHDRWDEMILREIPGTADVLASVRRAGRRLLGLTNFWPDTFRSVRERFPSLGLFDGFVVSGEEGVTKPDPEIYRILCRRFEFDSQEALFVDDVPANLGPAEALGFHTIRFTDAVALQRRLEELGVLPRS